MDHTWTFLAGVVLLKKWYRIPIGIPRSLRERSRLCLRTNLPVQCARDFNDGRATRFVIIKGIIILYSVYSSTVLVKNQSCSNRHGIALERLGVAPNPWRPSYVARQGRLVLYLGTPLATPRASPSGSASSGSLQALHHRPRFDEKLLAMILTTQQWRCVAASGHGRSRAQHHDAGSSSIPRGGSTARTVAREHLNNWRAKRDRGSENWVATRLVWTSGYDSSTSTSICIGIACSGATRLSA